MEAPIGMRRTDLLSALLLCAAIALGALREFVFVNLNYQIDFVLHARPINYAHSAFRAWADGMGSSGLIRAKWAFAAGFVAATLALTVALARVRLAHHGWMWAVCITFLSLSALALLLHALSGLLPALYPVAIALLHGLQYPVPLLVVWMLSWLRPTPHR
jgi:hypothetical protein